MSEQQLTAKTPGLPRSGIGADPLQGTGQSPQEAGRPLGQAGQPLVDEAGRPLGQAGQPLVDEAGRPLSQAGQPLVDEAGRPLSQAGQPLDEAGRPLGQAGQPLVDEAGRPLGQAGQPLNEAGQPLNEAGQPLKGFDPVTPGTVPSEERLKTGPLMAKVEPAEASRRMVEEMQAEQAALASAALKDIFFALDSWRLTEEAKQALSADAQWLKTNPGKLVTIEGHCDERGTLSYNLVLGEKRAKAVRNYLVELGVNETQLTVVSLGKERPFCKGQDEACYQQNRRAHLLSRTN